MGALTPFWEVRYAIQYTRINPSRPSKTLIAFRLSIQPFSTYEEAEYFRQRIERGDLPKVSNAELVGPLYYRLPAPIRETPP